MVQRQGGTISLRPVTDAIRLVQAGTDKTAAELALKRLSGELQNVEFEFTQLRFRRLRALQATGKVFCWVWIGGIVLSLFISAAGGMASYFAILIGIGVTAGVIYFWVKQKGIIGSRYDQLERDVCDRGNEIRRKIDRKKAFVD